jgi:DNA topoisomerase-6 subunit B
MSSDSKERFASISPAEFFKRNPELVGFSNPSRALYQSVRETVENSLDATDIHLILPSVKVSLDRIDLEKEVYRLTVEDNGIGIPPQVVPNAFGKVLYSSKYTIRQTRGMYGLGVKAVLLYSQMYQDRPFEVQTSPRGSNRVYYFKLKIDISRNEPIIFHRSSIENPTGWHGTIITVYLVGDWLRSKQKIYEYIKRTYILSPYAEFTFRDPEGNITYYPRVTNKLPRPPEEVKPHPYGVDIELLKYLIATLRYQYDVRSFLINEFQSIGEITAEEILKQAGVSSSTPASKLTDDQISKLVEVMKKYEKFRPPSADALSTLGEELITIGLNKVFSPDMVSAETRKPKAYQGHPFIVEAGIAYGGAIPPSEFPIVLRYANKIPLVYDEKSDVIWKVVEEIDWRRYGIEENQFPLVVLVHLCSTKVPYKSAGKESIADVEEIEKEIKFAIMSAARQLRLFLLERKKQEDERKRMLTYMKYIPELARSLAVFEASNENEIDSRAKELEKKLIEIVSKKVGLNDPTLYDKLKVEIS